MKRLLLIIWISIVPLTTFSQVTTLPINPTDNEEITILFDAAGTSLDGYTGDVYVFTGVTVNGGQFSNVLGDWGDNVTNPQLTRDPINLNLYTLLITPSIFDYYGVSTSDNITELVFIFRSADASLQTRPDIFIPIIATNPPPVPSNWGIVGTATPNGWNGPDIPLTYDAIANKWTAVVSLTNGEIKFRNDNNWIVNYGDNEPDGILDRNGANISIAAGYYHISFDYSTLTYEIKPLVSIPDPNFEQALIDLGIDSDGALNGMILKENVVNIDSLSIGSPLDHSKPFANPLLVNVIAEIADLTGIEAFTNLKYLSAGFNNINSIDLTQNTLLEELWINDNGCSFINVSNNTNLKKLGAYVNNLTALDLSNNPLLTQLYLAYNPQLKYLDVRNGNNNNISAFWVIETPNLTCINADTINSQVMIDSGKTLNENCGDFVYIPEANFEQALIDLGIDTDGDINSLILKSDAEAVTGQLNVNGKNIANLTGIEAFVNLTGIECTSNILTSLDFSSNTNLVDVFASYNSITNINLSNNSELKQLYITDNLLTELDVSNNLLLEQLFCYSNKLQSLDLSTNSNLEILFCANNQLTSLNIANGNNANFIPASWVNLSFAAEGNPDLKCIQADVNIIGNIPLHWLKDPVAIYSSDCITKPEYVYIPDANFEQALIDLGFDSDGVLNTYILKSDASLIIDLDVNNKNISSLAGIEHFDGLTSLYCNNNLLTEVNLGDKPNLINLQLGHNEINTIDLSNYPNLASLHIWANKLTTLDVNQNLNLEELMCSTNKLTSMDISINTKLKYINFADNRLVNLNIANGNNANFVHPEWAYFSFEASYNPALKCIQVDANIINNIPDDWFKDEAASYNENCPTINCEELVAIPDTNFEQALVDLGIDTNGLTGDILKCDALAAVDLNLNNKSISSLSGIEHFVGLRYLYCHNNLLTEINLGEKPNLINLHCGGNSLTSIDVSNYPNLASLHIWVNKLTILDVSKNLNLEELICSTNKLTTMDISSNSKLKFMNFADNKLVNLNIANGNNANFAHPEWADYSFDARYNPALNCIQVDADIINNIPSDWFKDESASYNENCPIINCEELVAIPDTNFEQALIDLGYDTNGLTGNIKKCEAASIIDLDLNSKNISSLSGIEHFVGLRYLYCNNNLLTEVNLGDKPNLINLDFGRNALTTIDVSNYSNLVSFNIWNNQLTTLDVSNNPNLEDLICFSNKLTTLDISLNTKLKFMNFSNNKLVNLNIANGNNINFSGPEWAGYSFYATNNPALMCIQVDAGIINNIPADWFKDEAASYNENCPTINCEELVAISDANFEQALIDLGFDSNGLTGDILKCDAAAVIDLDINNKNISSLSGIEHLVNLTNLYCNNNKINVLDLSSNTKLIGVLANQNFLTAINISNCPNLVTLHLCCNQLTSLNVENNVALKGLILLGNNLTNLDVSNNPNLTFLQCNYNQLTSLNIANGNNANFSSPDWTTIAMDASNNLNLSCIKVDEGIINNIPLNWAKDETASYSIESCESSPILYVNDNDLSGDLYTTAIGSNANPGTAALPFATIQQAIDNITVGGVIYVDAGIYMEDVVINKGVTLNGVQAGVNPVSSLTRGIETIVVSATEDPINRAVFILQASDITIDGFTIDGDNPIITGSVLLNDSDINAGFGIAKFVEPTAHNNLNIQNNIIKNFYRYGVFIQSTTELPLSGNLIAQNHFTNISAQNVDGNYGRWGRAIGLFGNAYASISQNVFTKVSTAVWASGFNAVSIDNSFITGNKMETFRSGIEFSGFSAGANHYQVNNNAISTGDLNTWNVPGASSSNNNVGIIAYSISNTTSQSFNNNTIINTQKGVLLINNISSVPGWAIHVNNNSITEIIGYAIQNSDGNKVNATCNWYGSAAVQDNLNKITAQTGYFAPFLTNGTDSDPITLGFQPAPDSCNGMPLSASVTSKTDVTCFEANNGSINISIDNLFTGKAPYTYLWTKDDEPAFTSFVEDPSNLAPGTYRVTITDDWGTNMLVDYNGNIITIEVDINEPEVLSATANVINNICFAGNTGSIIVTALGGTAPYSYLWSNGGTEDQISNLTQGIYSVLITDANGCTNNTQFEVMQPTQIELQLADLSTVCSNKATVSALGGTGDYTYLWSNGATSESINAVAAGTYNVIVTDANGCTMTGNITLAVKEAFNPSATITDVSCYGGADGSIIIGNVNGQAPFSYSIDGINYIQDQNQFSNLMAGIYTIGVRDANGCTGFVTKTI
ncbi:MAG: hypothetical protein CVU01_02085, partial [Bacteroidetes bacterium HGW-Bacteroidetes-18]